MPALFLPTMTLIGSNLSKPAQSLLKHVPPLNLILYGFIRFGYFLKGLTAGVLPG